MNRSTKIARFEEYTGPEEYKEYIDESLHMFKENASQIRGLKQSLIDELTQQVVLQENALGEQGTTAFGIKTRKRKRKRKLTKKKNKKSKKKNKKNKKNVSKRVSTNVSKRVSTNGSKRHLAKGVDVYSLMPGTIVKSATASALLHNVEPTKPIELLQYNEERQQNLTAIFGEEGLNNFIIYCFNGFTV